MDPKSRVAADADATRLRSLITLKKTTDSFKPEVHAEHLAADQAGAAAPNDATRDAITLITMGHDMNSCQGVIPVGKSAGPGPRAARFKGVSWAKNLHIVCL